MDGTLSDTMEGPLQTDSGCPSEPKWDTLNTSLLSADSRENTQIPIIGEMLTIQLIIAQANNQFILTHELALLTLVKRLPLNLLRFVSAIRNVASHTYTWRCVLF